MDHSTITPQIQYLKDCYTLDNASFTIQNFFDKKFQFQYIIETQEEELLNQAFPKTFVPDEIGESIEQILILNSEDKELLYCSLFICGTRSSHLTKKVNSVLSPLIYTHANINKTDEDYFVSLNSKPQLNIGFLKTLTYKTNFEQCRMALHQVIKSGLIDFKTVGEIKTILDQHVLDLDTEEIIMYPDLISKKERQSVFKPSQLKKLTGYKLVSCSGILVSSKANNTEAIDLEIHKILESNTFSEALQAYLGEENSPSKPEKINYIPPIPMVLNQSQEKVLSNVKSYANSVIIGPPGTGKSFTITALAMDLIRQGKKVLIATKTDRALDVIEEKLLSYNLENQIIKIGGQAYKRKIKKYIRFLTNGFYTNAGGKYFKDSKSRLNGYINNLTTLEQKYQTLTSDAITSAEEYIDTSGFKRHWKNFYYKHFTTTIGDEISSINDFYRTLELFIDEAEYFFKLTLQNQLENSINKNRPSFMTFLQSINTKDTGIKLSTLNTIDFSVILETIPLWLTKIKSVSEYLPLQKDLFDVVIIDEATQCDMSSCIPILQRGKKAVIAGDTNQLRHFSFLSEAQITNKLIEHKLNTHQHLNYRTNSMLDLMLHNAKHQNQVVALDEHYRSLPAIIEFSNSHFYSNRLKIMTAFPNHNPSKSLQAVKLNGERSEQGVNQTEIDQIVKLIQSIITNEETSKTPSSIGVLSPFRQQTEAITTSISEQFSTEDMVRHNILIGTPHSFQGSEKDVMILSFSIDNQFHHGSLQYLNKEDVFNVSITRAKTSQFIFYSVNPSKLPQSSLLRQYLEYIEHPSRHLKSPTKSLKENPTYQDIQDFLTQQGWPYYMNHELAGTTLDILFLCEEKYFAIDLIGFPGEEIDAFTMERYKVLNRVGIKVFPLSYLTWNFDKMKVINQLKSFINQPSVTSIYHSQPSGVHEF